MGLWYRRTPALKTKKLWQMLNRGCHDKRRSILVQLNVLDMTCLVVIQKAENSTPLIQKLKTSPLSGCFVSQILWNVSIIFFAAPNCEIWDWYNIIRCIVTIKVAIALCVNSVQHSARSNHMEYNHPLSKSRSKGRTVADSIDARLSRPTVTRIND
ncbi:hypothetical protein Tco_1247128 [Tanacetum coccineum]